MGPEETQKKEVKPDKIFVDKNKLNLFTGGNLHGNAF